MPDVTRIGKDTGDRVEAVFKTYSCLAEPFPRRIRAAAAAAKYVRGQPGRFDGKTQDACTHDLIDKIPAIIANVNVARDAQQRSEEIVHSHAAAPIAMSNIGAE